MSGMDVKFSRPGAKVAKVPKIFFSFFPKSCPSFSQVRELGIPKKYKRKFLSQFSEHFLMNS